MTSLRDIFGRSSLFVVKRLLANVPILYPMKIPEKQVQHLPTGYIKYLNFCAILFTCLFLCHSTGILAKKLLKPKQ